MIDKQTLTYTFTGQLTTEDNKTYKAHPFNVPEDVTNVHITFDYTPEYGTGRIHRNQVDISLDDPDGIRGNWSRACAENGIHVNAIASSPGFITGEVQAGEWTVYVAAHRILSPDTVEYTINITLSTDELDLNPPTYDGSQRVAKAETGWYRGDLHAHTLHSDGWWDIPEFTEYMRSRGLDFVSLSDHNTPTGLAQHRSQTEDGFLTMGGMELSTFNGHMLALGNSNWYEWRLGIRDGVDITSIMQAVVDSGALLIIAHPMAPDEPFCSGCHWFFDEARPGVAMGVEVWNGYWQVFNEQGLQQYYTWLNLGHRLVLTSGTDIHNRPVPDETRRAGANVVYAEELSEKAILDAVGKGHSYVSAEPELLLTATSASGKEAMCGDKLPNEASTIKVTWNDAHIEDILRFIVDGKVHEQVDVGVSGERQWTLEANQAAWCTVELRDANNDMWAVSNPIFFGED